MKRRALEIEKYSANHILQSKYEEKFRPIYDQRQRVIEGKEIINNSTIIEDIKNLNLKEDVLEEEKGIPNYWGQAIGLCEQFEEILNDSDLKILESLRDVIVNYLDNNNFLLQFFFNENEYFENEILEIKYIMGLDTGKIQAIESSLIKWKSEDKNPTIKKKTIKKKINKRLKCVEKTVKIKSFFNIFLNLKKPLETNETDEEDLEQIEETLNMEYDNGLFIKDDLIPFSLEYYLGINPGNPKESQDGSEEFPEDDETLDDPEKDTELKELNADTNKLNKI